VERESEKGEWSQKVEPEKEMQKRNVDSGRQKRESKNSMRKL